MGWLVRCTCGNRLQADRKHAGKTIECPACGKQLTIADAEPAAKRAPPIRRPPKKSSPDSPPIVREMPPAEPAPRIDATKQGSRARRVPKWFWLATAGMAVSIVLAVIVVVSLNSGNPNAPKEVVKQDPPPLEKKTSPDVKSAVPRQVNDDADSDPAHTNAEESSEPLPAEAANDTNATSPQANDVVPTTDESPKTIKSDANDTNGADPPNQFESAADLADPTSTALQQSAHLVLQMTDADEFNWGFVFPLVTSVKVVGHEEIQVRYREVVKMVPVYQNKYESEVKVVPVRQGYATRLKQVVHKKLVSRKKIGQRPVKTLKQDDQGPIVRYHKKAIFGPGGTNTEPVSWPGNNAMALYTLLKAGVPGDNPRVTRLAESLARYLGIYGTGELTWDIAWCLTAFSEYPGDAYDYLIDQLVARLVAGRITSGKGQKLWGPLCINPDLLVRLYEEYSWIEGQVQQLEAFAKAQPKNPIIQDQLAKAKELHERLFEQIKNASRYATRLNHVMHAMVIKDDLEKFGPRLSVSAPPYNPYREVIADLESTALAIYALRAAHRRGKLPETVSLPYKDRQGAPLLPDIQVAPALTRTLEKLAAAQQEDGSWDEMISRETVEKFAKLPDTIIGPGVEVPEVVQSRKTPIANAQGYGALEDLVEILGPDACQPKVAVTIARARKHIGAYLRMAVQPDEGPDEYWAPYRIMDPRLGGRVELLALLYHLRVDAVALTAEEDLEAYRKLLETVFKTQQADGLWKTLPYALPYTPGLRERARVIVKYHHDELARTKPDLKDHFNGSRFLSRAYGAGRWLPVADDANRLATLYAMLFLAEQANGPIDFVATPEELVTDQN